MADYKFDRNELRDRCGSKVAVLDGKYIRDHHGNRLGEIDGKYLKMTTGTNWSNSMEGMFAIRMGPKSLRLRSQERSIEESAAHRSLPCGFSSFDSWNHAQRDKFSIVDVAGKSVWAVGLNLRYELRSRLWTRLGKYA